ncbi:hypothetical protein GQ602_001945 [Ophiocordyceps camponoti-floridani]|uniref:Uncharacterized protein n=1 Tax=Ophiocordyceps camponoti-floridani TaxID=2030778 RepID=A0A8H4Q9D9_9HYPO|nr:hypothetical protein GQ602_001945 [Ophiocordyceps camponoti-floridani]
MPALPPPAPSSGTRSRRTVEAQPGARVSARDSVRFRAVITVRGIRRRTVEAPHADTTRLQFEESKQQKKKKKGAM